MKRDYREARAIISHSPRSAAALLRICLLTLLAQVGGRGSDPDRAVAALVRKGLPPTMHAFLQAARVIGKDAIRPGLLDGEDDEQTATKLFAAVNLIAKALLTCPREAEDLYRSLPRRPAAGLKSPERRKGHGPDGQ